MLLSSPWHSLWFPSLQLEARLFLCYSSPIKSQKFSCEHAWSFAMKGAFRTDHDIWSTNGNIEEIIAHLGKMNRHGICATRLCSIEETLNYEGMLSLCCNVIDSVLSWISWQYYPLSWHIGLFGLLLHVNKICGQVLTIEWRGNRNRWRTKVA